MAVSHWHIAFACAVSVACGVDTTGLGKPDGSTAGSPSAAAGAGGSSAGAGGAKDPPSSSAGSATQNGGAGGMAAAGMPGAAGAQAAGGGGGATTECKLSSPNCRACMISNCYAEGVACSMDKACNDSGDSVVACYCTAHKPAADCTDALGDISLAKDLAACMMLQCEERCL